MAELKPHIIDDGFGEPEQVRKIFVGNLPYEADEEMLKSHFSQFGEIMDCVVPKDPKTKFAKGFGFVTFTRGKAVDDVMSNRPHKVAGRVLEPKRAISRNESRDPAAAVSTSKLYIGSIGDLSEEELRTFFLKFGSIDEIDVQSAKGQAFITFSDHDPVDRIVTEKHTVCGRPVEVRKALTRHQIETATKRRENQARKGAFDREKRHTPEGGAGYPDRSAAPRYDPRERNPYDDRGGYGGRGGYDRPAYSERHDPYARERSPPRSYDHARGYDRGASDFGRGGYDRYAPPREDYYRDRYGPPEVNRYAPPPPRDYDRDRYAPPRGGPYPDAPYDRTAPVIPGADPRGPPPPRDAYPPYDAQSSRPPYDPHSVPPSSQPPRDDAKQDPGKAAVPPMSYYAHQASVPPEARAGYAPQYPPEQPPPPASNGYPSYR